jgi:N-acetylneuraminic acid mutarotase
VKAVRTLKIGVLAVLGIGACQSDGTPSGPEMEPGVEVRADVAPAANTWVKRADMPTGRSGLVAAAVNGVVYAIGGATGEATAKVEAYFPNLTSFVLWGTKAPLPAPRVYPHGAAVLGGKIYVPGGLDAGHNPTKTLYRYNPATNTWTRKADLPRAGFGGVSAAIDGKLYVYVPYGPDPYGPDPDAALYRYDPSTNAWTQRAQPPAFQRGAAVGVINGKMYLAGGMSAQNQLLATLRVYDPASDSWTLKTPMPTARAVMTGRAIDGKLYVAGGYSSKTLDVTEVYNPATNSWSVKAPMTTPRYGAASAVVSGKLYVIGGGNQGGKANEMYTP